MRYLSEYRDPDLARAALAELHRVVTKPWAIMEVCGGQTPPWYGRGSTRFSPPGSE